MTSSARRSQLVDETNARHAEGASAQKALPANVVVVAVLTTAFFVVFHFADDRTWLLAVPAAFANLLVLRSLATSRRALPTEATLAHWVCTAAITLGLMPVVCLLALVVGVLATIR